MANVTVRGTSNLNESLAGLADLTGGPIGNHVSGKEIEASSTSYLNVNHTSPLGSFNKLVLEGTGLTYDENNLPIGGTITSIGFHTQFTKIVITDISLAASLLHDENLAEILFDGDDQADVSASSTTRSPLAASFDAGEGSDTISFGDGVWSPNRGPIGPTTVSADTGTGDDTVLFDLAKSGLVEQIATTGAGKDVLKIQAADLLDNAGNASARMTITDFDPASDRLELPVVSSATRSVTWRMEASGEDTKFTLIVTDPSTPASENPAIVLVNNVSPDQIQMSAEGVVTGKDEAGTDEEPIFGTNNGDSLRGDEGDNVIIGLGGPDGIMGFAGDDVLLGGDGRDLVYGAEGDDQLFGGNGGDYLFGGSDDDVVFGGAGNDVILGDTPRYPEAAGNDGLFGGDGDDKISAGGGDDYVSGGTGNDELKGQEGNDEIDGGLGSDALHGGDGNDFLMGGDDADTVSGDAGNDRLFGDRGNDTLYGGDGNDEVHGGLGDDLIYGDFDGTNGFDQLFGEEGNDQLYGGADADIIDGGAGNDLLFGQDGSDKLRGGDGDDVLIGAEGRDEMLGGAGNDALDGGEGADRMDGGDGNDQLFGGENSDFLHGGNGDDLIIGDGANDSGNDSLFGGKGDDLMFAGDGKDFLRGDEGNDVLFGEAGDDRISVGAGTDTIVGGSGADIVELETNNGINFWLDFEDGVDKIHAGGVSGGFSEIQIYSTLDGTGTWIGYADTQLILEGVDAGSIDEDDFTHLEPEVA